ncbi:hypothetical protein AAC03nite_34460 [Alicyclobacillus acidoterrestris]|uniref:FAD-dependent oxidoreductase n=1 Tax=Alicyclobacillus suci TaxID=2816080 RepID=UPI001195A617|nr:NAD(P)/FAD-dependent oxidoreductase [Alicyclobacillus suci]GEO27661.1 hypothetical protein AAC03nite_34460 [Alicyclobacillus acidoterrestris]
MLSEQVIIAGAGPVGLTVAEILSQKGISVVVLEKDDLPGKEWRASTFHSATMELLEPFGIADELLKVGLKADRIQYRDRQTGLYAEFDCNLLSNDTKYPFRLQCPQSTYVRIVYDRVKQRDSIDVRFHTKVVSFEQDDDGVTVTVEGPEGEYTLRGAFLLGADGARSTVRHQLGVKFEGYTLEERFLLVGTSKPFDIYLKDIAYVNYVSDPDEFLFILRVPDAWRLLWPVPPSVPDDVALDEAYIQSKFQAALHTSDTFPIIEHMIYRVHQRVSEKFYRGRVILLGDAAHVNSPLGGLGLNSGIHDAVDLSHRLLRIFESDGENIVPELETYANVRRAVAVNYVRSISEKNTKVMTEKNEEDRLRLQREMAEIAADPERAYKWLLNSSLLLSVREQGIGERPSASHV